jgi:hypothetical protein
LDVLRKLLAEAQAMAAREEKSGNGDRKLQAIIEYERLNTAYCKYYSEIIQGKNISYLETQIKGLQTLVQNCKTMDQAQAIKHYEEFCASSSMIVENNFRNDETKLKQESYKALTDLARQYPQETFPDLDCDFPNNRFYDKTIAFNNNIIDLVNTASLSAALNQQNQAQQNQEQQIHDQISQHTDLTNKLEKYFAGLAVAMETLNSKSDRCLNQQADLNVGVAGMMEMLKCINDKASDTNTKLLMSILDKVQACCPPPQSKNNIPVVQVPIPEPQQQYVTVPIPPSTPKPVTFEYTYKPPTATSECCPPGYIAMDPGQYRGVVNSETPCPANYSPINPYLGNPYGNPYGNLLGTPAIPGYSPLLPGYGI